MILTLFKYKYPLMLLLEDELRLEDQGSLWLDLQNAKSTLRANDLRILILCYSLMIFSADEIERREDKGALQLT